mmetsp:Transcript_56796/g.176642  ORF Transcript_56796/g.176642 Transcript_56796/m.176642 type:complete len:343 (+) Transcript_56796:78-1106(+)
MDAMPASPLSSSSEPSSGATSARDDEDRLLTDPASCLSMSTCSPRPASIASTMADSPTPTGRPALSDLLLPFALLRIKALEKAVAGHQTQLDQLRPLRQDMLELHTAVAALREAGCKDVAELHEAQSDQEERLSAEIASLGDQVAILERCVEENDAKLNSVQTSLLEDHVESAVAIDDRLRAAKRHSLEEGDGRMLRDVLQLERRVVGAPARSRAQPPPQLPPAGGVEHAGGAEAKWEAPDLVKQLEVLDGRIEECFKLLRDVQRHSSMSVFRGAPDRAASGKPAGSMCSPRCPAAAKDRSESEFDDDVGEAERPVPRPCQSRPACTSPASRLAMHRQDAIH